MRWLTILGPGVLVAATGVGAGDLATAAFVGEQLGVVVLWAVLVGAFLKFVLNEGLTRWQLVRGTTLLEGTVTHLGNWAGWLFLAYLLVWSFLVAAALMSAIGVTAHALLPLFGNDGVVDKVVYGIAHSGLAVLLVTWGGFRLFEKVMGVCISLMFVVVVVTAIALQPSWRDCAAGLVWLRIPPGGGSWTIALLGGVGGTVTILCYGYWIREESRRDTSALPVCRVDLAVGYTMTAVFGLAMMVIGNALPELEGRSALLIVEIARQLEVVLGPVGWLGKWAFLIGAWGAVFSSLLGVWQSIPYLFADLWGQLRATGDSTPPPVDATSSAYRGYLWGLATLPVIGLVAVPFALMQKTYAIVGALFIPLLCLVLLWLCGGSRWLGSHRNRIFTNLLLLGTLVFFVFIGWRSIAEKFGG